MYQLQIGDIVLLTTEENKPNGYVIQLDYNKDEYKVRWFDGWRDTWHSHKFLKKVEPLDQSKRR
jgi:hypothetical protein